jgi:mannose-6-phosphate isomerase class I
MTNYEKRPFFRMNGKAYAGWNAIKDELNVKISTSPSQRYILIVECYQGVYHDELIREFEKLNAGLFLLTDDAFYPEDKIREMVHPDVTDDEIFGYMTRLTLNDYLDPEKVEKIRGKINKSTGLVVLYGYAASLIAEKYDCLVYADMPRWEIQLRQRRNEVNNIGIRNAEEAPSIKYKRGFFVDWRVCDRLKQQLFEKADYWLDSTIKDEPRMIAARTLLDGLTALSKTPFRLVPYFDPGPWGGQWMKKVCGLDASKPNYAWAFDCVPEENSLLFEVEGEFIEVPAINLVFYKATELLGEPVESRFGKEFPIRFDFLDTIQGGNLSLQVHPTRQYIHEHFGMSYTQDESYYLLDARPDAVVYLGMKTGCDPQAMVEDLEKSQETGAPFDTERYVNKFPAKKHDHFLIPNGTVHCSGTNGMVLEISATPYIFTFKLYDWGRLGLDGRPRPINIAHGANVIQWNRDTQYCQKHLVNQVQRIAEGDGWWEEKTGLHPNEFIETRRHWFTKTVRHQTADSVNVLNLVEGSEAIVESPNHQFSPFVVHYAETFIVPAEVGEYTIRPYGESEGKLCATIKAYVRHQA